MAAPTGSPLADIGPLDPRDLPWSTRWDRLADLETAVAKVPEAQPALRILRWGCHTPARRAEALAALASVPAARQRVILERYRVLAAKRREAA